ncbi:hypothetical protein OnM2_009030, partial [Erysiphe neolycopersici]
MEKVDAEVAGNWVENTGATLGPGILNLVCRDRVLRLLYTYQDLNATESEHIEATDLFEHKVKLKEGIEPWIRSNQKRWLVGQEYWLQKTDREGLRRGMYDGTIFTNSKLSSWNAQPVLVLKDKIDPGPRDEMRVTFNYRDIEENLLGFFLELM